MVTVKRGGHYVFFIWYNLDAYNPHTPHSHHTHIYACASVHMQWRDWEARCLQCEENTHYHRTRTHACTLKFSKKSPEKGAITRVWTLMGSVLLDSPTTGPQAHSRLPYWRGATNKFYLLKKLINSIRIIYSVKILFRASFSFPLLILFSRTFLSHTFGWKLFCHISILVFYFLVIENKNKN